MGLTQHSGGGGKMLQVFHAANVGAREREGNGEREEREGSGVGSTCKKMEERETKKNFKTTLDQVLCHDPVTVPKEYSSAACHTPIPPFFPCTSKPVLRINPHTLRVLSPR
jgi:hypothetical protein